MQSIDILSDIKCRKFCRVTGQLKLTKTHSNFSDVLISRDCDLEEQTQSWIGQRTSTEKIFHKYKNYDNSLKDFSWPQHYPVRLLSGTGSACSGKNIFMFFPHVLNQTPTIDAEVFGFEFVDIWSNIFRSTIFPIAHRVFTKETLIDLFSLQKNLEKTIYLASVFHEIGHRCGPYKVSPVTTENMRLEPSLLDVMGELSTDALLIKTLTEFPEIVPFVVLQRLFWFGRRGFRHNPISANLNSDNDSWLGSLIWQQLLKDEGLIPMNGKYHLNFDSARKSFTRIIPEIDSLIFTGQDSFSQNQAVKSWMKTKVPSNLDNFILPDSFRSLLEELQDVEEIPHFQTPYSYSYINELLGAIKNEKTI